ncbi:hypothetical protein NW065_02635 [Mycoplasmopsis cynos]|nr:hypothetical protein [Mycoplasmopsis cynos]UWV81965.1 hypothetical protein NW065_02635 [Mycoplasmopsis cynos]WAM04683.1 hypothetical protein ONA01_00285 [Mycoplasmopsis cynos]WAM10575.1 hypothetical protein ONA00_04335 [Mycoplasmopsis cynos]
MVRREFPKGTNFNKISEKEIYDLQKTINNIQEKFIIISLLMNYFLI